MLYYSLQVNEQGELAIPAELPGAVAPGTRYQVEVHGSSLILKQDTHSELAAKRWREWATSHPPQKSEIPGEALRREEIYE
ncbi:MAG: hypothetical protein OHK0012_18220 [Synechococcales cyanobacterium]